MISISPIARELASESGINLALPIYTNQKRYNLDLKLHHFKTIESGAISI